MVYQYKTSGTCSSRIEFELDDNNRIHNVHFTNGCNGNLKGISAIVEGMNADELISKLGGITCGFKSTSCPDQLAKAVRQALDKK